MRTVLLVRASLNCRQECPGCRYSGITHSASLQPRILERVTELLGGFKFDEALLLCPLPPRDRLSNLIEFLESSAKRFRVFVPVSSLSSLPMNLFSRSAEVVVVVPEGLSLQEYLPVLRSILSQGIENLSLYIAVPSSPNLRSVRLAVRSAKCLGLKLRLGEAPYAAIHTDLRSKLLELGVEVGLSYGYLYGLRAATAFVDEYPVTVLSRPEGSCRKLYVSPSGRLSKCPFVGPAYDVVHGEVSISTVRKIIYSECSYSLSMRDIIPRVEVSFSTRSGVEIPREILDLLELVEYTKSLRRACSMLGIPYSSCVEKLKILEKELGVKLVITKRGGASRGVTMLTSPAESLVRKYKLVKQAISEALARYLEEG